METAASTPALGGESAARVNGFMVSVCGCRWVLDVGIIHAQRTGLRCGTLFLFRFYFSYANSRALSGKWRNGVYSASLCNIQQIQNELLRERLAQQKTEARWVMLHQLLRAFTSCTPSILYLFIKGVHY